MFVISNEYTVCMILPVLLSLAELTKPPSFSIFSEPLQNGRIYNSSSKYNILYQNTFDTEKKC